MKPKRATSGEHKAVKTFRQKLESIQDGTLEELLELNRQLDAQLEGCPPKDARRDGDSDPPVDKIEFPTIPVPPEKKP